MAYEFRIIKDLSPIRICVRSSSIFFSFLALLLRLLPITGQSDWQGAERLGQVLLAQGAAAAPEHGPAQGGDVR